MGEDYLPPVVASILADLDQFNRALDDATSRMERFVAEMEALGDIKVKLSVDTEGLREDVQRAVDEAQAGQGLAVSVTVDSADLRDQISRADEEAKAGQEIEVPAVADTTELRPELVRAVEEAKTGEEIVLPVAVDLDKLQEELKAGTAAASVGEGLKVPVTADEAALREEVRAIVEKAGLGEEIKVPVKADASSVSTDLKTAWDAASNQLVSAATDTGDRAGKGLNNGILGNARVLLKGMSDTSTVMRADFETKAQQTSDAWAKDFDAMSQKTTDLSKAFDSQVRLSEAAYRDLSSAVKQENDKIVASAAQGGEAAGRAWGDKFASFVENSASGKLKTIDLNPGAGQFNVPVQALPLAIPAVADLEALTGVLGLVPAAFTAAATAAATFAVGVGDVGKAVTAYQAIETAQDAQALKTAATAAQQMSTNNAIINSHRQLADATQAVTDAQRTSADSIISAQQAVKNAVQSAADAQRNSDNSIISATEAVANAKLSEANAEKQAALDNQNALATEQKAEVSLTNAQQAATRAQTALTDAREAAKRSIEDLAFQVQDDALAQQQGVLAVQQAQAQLNQTMADPTATDLQRQQAQLSVEAAQQALTETGVAYQRAQADSTKASAAGVEGAQQVVSAQDQIVSSQGAVSDATTSLAAAQQNITDTQIKGAQAVTAAQQQVGDSQRALTQAQISGAESIANANQQVIAAQRSLVTAQISGAESIKKANEGVTTAQQGVAQALAQQAAAVEALNAPMAAYEQILGKLAPSAKAAVEAWNAITGPTSPFESLHLDVQQRMFAGVGDEIKAIANADLPILRTGMDGMADVFSHVFRDISDFLTAPASASDWTEIFKNIDTAGQNLSESIKPIEQIFTDITTVGSEFLPGIAQNFSDMAQHVADFVHNARETGQLKQWIQEGLDAFGHLWDIIKNVAAIINDLAGGPSNGGLLAFLDGITSAVRWILDNMPGAKQLVDGLILAWGATRLIKPIGTIIDVISSLVTKIKGWVTSSQTADTEVATSAEESARRQAVAAESASAAAQESSRLQGLAAEQSSLAMKQAALAMEQASLQMRTAYADAATGAEAASLKMKIADDEAILALKAEAVATEEQALKIKASYAEIATAAELSSGKVVAADGTAGVAAEGEAAAAGGAAGKGLLGGKLGSLALIAAPLAAAQGILAWLDSHNLDKVGGDASKLSPTGSAVHDAAGTLPAIGSAVFSGDLGPLKAIWNDLIKQTEKSFGQLSSAPGVKFFEALWGDIQKANTALGNFNGQVEQAFSGAGSWLLDAGKALWHGFWDDGVLVAYHATDDWLKGLHDRIHNYMAGANTWLVQEGSDLLNGFGSGIVSAWNAAWAFIAGIPGWIIGHIKSAFGISSPSTVMATIGMDIVQGLLDGVAGKLGSLLSLFGTIPGQIGNLLAGAGSWLFQAGINLIMGLWNGLASWTGTFRSFLNNWLQSVWTGIKGFFGIHSPSTLMATAGESIAQGLAAGIDTNAHLATTSAQNMAKQVAGAISGISGTASLDATGGAIAATASTVAQASAPLQAASMAINSEQWNQITGWLQNIWNSVNQSFKPDSTSALTTALSKAAAGIPLSLPSGGVPLTAGAGVSPAGSGVPLALGSGSGPAQVTVNVHVAGNVTSEQALAVAILPTIQQGLRQYDLRNTSNATSSSFG